jgi:hypothetical protein
VRPRAVSGPSGAPAMVASRLVVASPATAVASRAGGVAVVAVAVRADGRAGVAGRVRAGHEATGDERRCGADRERSRPVRAGDPSPECADSAHRREIGRRRGAP